MDLARLYDELSRAARRVGADVRAEAFEPGLREASVPRGGLCVVHGKKLLLVDAAAALPERVAMLARGLAELDLDHIYLTPRVRATIALHRAPLGVNVEDVGEPILSSSAHPANDDRSTDRR
jgi:hypothetical protein